MEYRFLPALFSSSGLLHQKHCEDALLSYLSFRTMIVDPPTPGSFRFGDSGGYSIVGQGAARLDPVDVLRWQMAVTSAGACLDVPPGARYPFEEARTVTVRNLQRTVGQYIKYRKGGGTFRWYGVVHGQDEQQFDYWWQTMRSVYSFGEAGEGWAMPMRFGGSSAERVARAVRWFNAKGITRIHLFMVADVRGLATLLALLPETKLEWVTSDATTAERSGSQRAAYFLTSDGLRYRYMEEGPRGDGLPAGPRTGREVRTKLLEECQCYSCAELRRDATLDASIPDGDFTTYWAFRFSYHNVLTFRALVANLQPALRDNPRLLRDILGADEYHAVYRAFAGNATIVRTPPRTLLSFLEDA